MGDENDPGKPEHEKVTKLQTGKATMREAKKRADRVIGKNAKPKGSSKKK